MEMTAAWEGRWSSRRMPMQIGAWRIGKTERDREREREEEEGTENVRWGLGRDARWQRKWT
jgi:hypothetical protein